jgi:uncharacterized protein (TIGR03083 family)
MGADRVPEHLAYRAVRDNVGQLVRNAPDAAGTTVPACPEWTVRDLVAHLAGNCSGMLREPGVSADAGLSEQLAWWQVTGERMELLAAAGALRLHQLLMDAFTHELDLRSALGVAAPADHPAYPAVLDVVASGLDWSVNMHGLPAVGLSCDGRSWVAGPGRPLARVSGSCYHLYRSLTGRRTAAQIAALDWDTDPWQWLPAFYWGPFSEPAGPTEPGPGG